MTDNIEKAWDKVKRDDDAPYAVAHPDLKAELAARAEALQRTGATTLEAAGGDREKTVYDKFEDELKKLNASKDESKSDPAANNDKPLDKLSRAELDVIAKEEFGFNPSDYSNKEEIVAAIEEARAK